MVGNFNFRSVKNHDASSWVRDFKSRVFPLVQMVLSGKTINAEGDPMAKFAQALSIKSFPHNNIEMDEGLA